MIRKTIYVAMSSSVLAIGVSARAELVLPSVIGEHMVLQRNTEAAIWGWDEPGREVRVSFRGRAVEAEADESGEWLAWVPTGDAGGPFELTIVGSERRTLRDVMVGEVWVAGGQSNMWWQVSRSSDFERVRAESGQHAQVRFYDGNTDPREGGWWRETPQRTIPQAAWQTAGPETVGGWASTAYHFALRLSEELDVPVGIVHIAVPGQAAQVFMSEAGVKQHLPGVYAEWQAAVERWPEVEAAYEQRLKAYQEELAAWEAGDQAGRRPEEPDGPRSPIRQRGFGWLYHGMVVPVAPYTTRGFIWWQGESNADDAKLYAKLMPELIRQWRALWGEPGLPFFQVELHNFGPPIRPTVHQNAPWPRMRDAQRRTAEQVDGAYLVSVIDIKLDPPAEAHWEIHPARKHIAGRRLAVAALEVVYDRGEGPGFGPWFRKAEFTDGEAILHFDHVGEGLAIADDAGLPAAAFRTDDWPLGR